jgi:signal transduction histidine kinase
VAEQRHGTVIVRNPLLLKSFLSYDPRLLTVWRSDGGRPSRKGIADDPGMLHPPTAFLIVGLLFIALPAAAWTILHRRHDRVAVALWCSGSLLYGVGFILLVLREPLPDWLAPGLASPLMFAAYPLRGAAMQRERGLPVDSLRLALPWVLAAGLYSATWLRPGIDEPRFLIALAVNLAGAGWLAWTAWQLHRATGYRSAALVSGTFALYALALAVRLTFVGGHWSEPRPFAGSLDFVLSFASSVVAALFGNLGYIGIALEKSRDHELRRSAELARELERRAQTELRNAEQAALLDERGRLLSSREEMLAVLAHEVRQPLNNASAALQSAAQALAGGPDDRERASARLRRAKTVLAQVTASLDNTLTDAVLLGGDGPLARQDIDIDTLVSLAIADIDPASRERIVRSRTTSTRTASMHAGLMRLALRNLLTNALAYGPPDQPVTVQIADSDEPLALLIEVSDRGAGFPPELAARLFTRGARGDHVNNPRGHGLGLYVTQRILQMHGGEVRVRQEPSGLTMQLVVPQAFDD